MTFIKIRTIINKNGTLTHILSKIPHPWLLPKARKPLEKPPIQNNPISIQHRNNKIPTLSDGAEFRAAWKEYEQSEEREGWYDGDGLRERKNK